MKSLAQILVDRLRQELRDEPLFVGLDGRSGSGKSTLAEQAQALLGTDILTIIEGDSFCGGGSSASWDARTVEEKVAGVIDWRRQRKLLEALRQMGEGSWRPFDWDSEDWDSEPVPLAAEPMTCRATPIVLLEGAYSCRPELADLLDLRILLEVPVERRRQQLLQREGAEYREDWERRWSEAEAYYFGQVVSEEEFDLLLRCTS